MSSDLRQLFVQYRDLLFTLAYQLTGSAVDAEDIVQDVFVKLHEVDLRRLTEPKAFLCKMVTNRCMDLHKSARNRKEQYFGTWLPEPIFIPDDDAYESVIRKNLLSYAMLVLLERLSPSERAVFVLREAFGFAYGDIALLIDKSEAGCRKIMSRARLRMGISPDEAVHPEEAEENWVRKFIADIESGRVENIVALLAEDVVVVSDGGGKATSAVHLIVSRDRVVPFLMRLARKAMQEETTYRFDLVSVNGQAGLIVMTDKGIDSVALVHVEEGKLKRLYFVRNPDKFAFVRNKLLPGKKQKWV